MTTIIQGARVMQTAVTVTLLLAVAALTATGVLLAQDSKAIGNLQVNTSIPGQASLTWDDVPGITDYRVNWKLASESDYPSFVNRQEL